MPEVSILILATLFLCIAYFSSSVGLGGGSSYTALMAVAGISTLAIPLVSLSLNLVVTSIGSYQFIRHRHLSWKLVAPFLASSLPMAHLGGSLDLPKQAFYGILFGSLLIIVLRIFLLKEISVRWKPDSGKRLLLSITIGSILGFVAGAAGIGGGIYLVPIIILLGLGTEKQAAASGALFIWLNSLVGMIARTQHHSVNLIEYIPLLIAVCAGGFMGSFMGAARLSPQTMQKILGYIIIVALVLLTRKLEWL